MWGQPPSAVRSSGSRQKRFLRASVSPWWTAFMLRLGQSHYDALRQHGEVTYPHECCSVLLGRIEDYGTRVITSRAPAGNTRNDSPQNRYKMHPKELVRIQRAGRERHEDTIGFY